MVELFNSLTYWQQIAALALPLYFIIKLVLLMLKEVTEIIVHEYWSAHIWRVQKFVNGGGIDTRIYDKVLDHIKTHLRNQEAFEANSKASAERQWNEIEKLQKKNKELIEYFDSMNSRVSPIIDLINLTKEANANALAQQAVKNGRRK